MAIKKTDHLKRVIVDFKKLTPEILKMLVDKYPYGYDDDHIIEFKNAKNEWVECVEVITKDTKYLVKVGAKLEATMENYNVDDYVGFENNDPEAVVDPNLEDDNFNTDNL